MDISRNFFRSHHLNLSTSKSKIMTHNSATGETEFSGNQRTNPVILDQVAAFKYLGVTISTSPYGFFRAHNENTKAKARQYLQRVLSLVKTGPDRADLAYSLWSNCALPAILYGSEVVPLNQGTIQEIERCQSRVGKFMLQVPVSSSTVCTHIDCGFRPIWANVAERVLTNASKLMSNPITYWPKLAYQEHLSQGTSSSYMKYLNKWKEATNSFGIHPKQIKKNVKFYAIKDVLDNKFNTSTTSFALSCPGTTPRSHWFKIKPWVTDSGFTEIFSEFRTCNARLGNRSPTKDGRFFKLCPLCEANGDTYLNNEVSNNRNK